MVNMENYEEYMLLYADRELTPEQEKALLDFVALHPELKPELEAYAATRLQPEEAMIFTGKDALIKTEPKLCGWVAGRLMLLRQVLYSSLFCSVSIAIAQKKHNPLLSKTKP
ncbi:MAG: hypothetical protein H3C54_00600 [Taibaiella sp.]|nr:hypothetical protein [Taibaiella sp.]